MKIGDKITIKNGATKWMKEQNYWLESMGTSIDGLDGEIINDYTDLPGTASHFEVSIGFEYGVGVHPQWLKLL